MSSSTSRWTLFTSVGLGVGIDACHHGSGRSGPRCEPMAGGPPPCDERPSVAAGDRCRSWRWPRCWRRGRRGAGSGHPRPAPSVAVAGIGGTVGQHARCRRHCWRRARVGAALLGSEPSRRVAAPQRTGARLGSVARGGAGARAHRCHQLTCRIRAAGSQRWRGPGCEHSASRARRCLT